MFTVSAAVGLIAVLPLLRKRTGPGLSVAILLAAALVAGSGGGIAAGLQQSRRLSASICAMWSGTGKHGGLPTRWQRLPDRLRAAAKFSSTVQHLPVTGYVAPAGAAQFPAPDASVSRRGRDVMLDLDAPGDGVSLLLPRQAQLKSVDIGGIRARAEGQVDAIICATPDCGRMQMTLHLGTSAPFEIVLRSVNHGLPLQGMALIKARSPDGRRHRAATRHC